MTGSNISRSQIESGPPPGTQRTRRTQSEATHRMFLTDAEADAINAQVAGVESRTGVEVATAVVGKSDTYVELPWKAFALGASLASFGVVIADVWRPDWVTA